MFNFIKKAFNKDENTQENNSLEVSSINEPKELDNLINSNDNNLEETIEKTGQNLVGNFLNLFNRAEKIDDDTLDELEETLIKADLGVETSSLIIDNLRAKKNSITKDNLKDFLKNQFMEILKDVPSSDLNFHAGLNIFLVTGVNGAGKTTLIGKMAYNLKQSGKKVLIAAGDTFRAAAEEQLDIWSKRAGADIVRNDGADPASVVFDAIRKAKSENYDILLIDTAGRLQNKFNLMEELGKIKRVIDKEADGLLTESILVIDATTGQNALKQAEVFSQCVNLTSVALTKLDGSAKGAIVIAIAREMKIPVKLVGVGEKMTDLKEFSPQEFIEALF